MSASRTKFYLDKQNAKWSGVCAGIADYSGIDVLWVRVGAVLLAPDFGCGRLGWSHGPPNKRFDGKDAFGFGVRVFEFGLEAGGVVLRVLDGLRDALDHVGEWSSWCPAFGEVLGWVAA